MATFERACKSAGLAAAGIAGAAAAGAFGAARVPAGGPSHLDERVTTTSKGHATTYVTRALHGFVVHVDERLLADGANADAKSRELGAAALAVLDEQLFEVERTLRDAPLARVRSIPVWLGLDDPVAPCACYHPSPDWLAQNGFDPKKAKSVEIAHAGAFVDWTHEQPWMVLHELAHGYDDQFLRPSGDRREPTDAKFETDAALGARVEPLFEQAKASHRYESVLHWNGGRQRHYALENSKEYFAESTEAWLGQNDFFPFVRAELLDFDPAMAALLRDVWGEPVTSARPR